MIEVILFTMTVGTGVNSAQQYEIHSQSVQKCAKEEREGGQGQEGYWNTSVYF